MAKKFLIVDRSGNLLFSHHPDGYMLGLLWTNFQKFAKLNLQDRYASARTQRGGRFVFSQFTHMNFLVYTEDENTEIFLKSLLLLLYELMILVWGSAVLASKGFGMTGTFHKHAHQLPALISTASHLCDTHQSFLVKALEMLEVNSDIRAAFVLELKSALKDLANAAHAVIFVGTKILAVYSKPKTFDLNTTDLLLLSIYVQAQFHPASTTFPPQTKINNAEPSDDASDSSNSSVDQQEEPIFGSNVFQTDIDERVPVARLREALPSIADASAFPSLSSFEARETFDLLHLRAKACWVPLPGVAAMLTDLQTYCSEFAPQISLVILSGKGTGSDTERRECARQRDQLKAAMKDSLAFLFVKDKTHVSMLGLPYIHQFPGLVHFLFVDRTRNRVYAPAITALHASGTTAFLTVEGKTPKVWQAVSNSVSFLAAGYNFAHVKDEDLQCTYRDDTGQEVPLERALIGLGLPLNVSYYDLLLKTQHPSLKNAKCYEMVTIYVASVPFDHVSAANVALSQSVKRNNL